MRRKSAWVVFGIAAGVLGALLVVPLALVVRGGFFEGGRFTLRYLWGVFQNPVYAEGLRNSLGIAVGTCALASAIAIPLAWIADRFAFPFKRVLGALILVPMILPPFVGAIGLQQLFGVYGAVNAVFGLGPVDWLGRGRYAGVVILQALALYPILYLNVAAALANIDPAMEEAAANVGCTGFRRFRKITWPLILPGFFAGGAIVFIWSFTELGTPLILNYTRCAPVQVFSELKEISSNPFPYALVVVMLTASLLLYAGVRHVFGRRAWAMQGKASTAAAPRALRGWRGLLAALPFVLVAGLALLPHLGVVLTSVAAPGSWYQSAVPRAYSLENFTGALGHGMTLQSIRNSLVYASMATGLTLVLGIAVARVTVRSDLPVRGLLDALAMLPLAVPGLVMAFGYLAVSAHFSNRGWVRESPFWQALFDVRSNPTIFLVLAYGVRRLPYMVRSVAAGLQQTSPVYEEAAASLGARPAVSLRRITLPLIAANLIAGGLLTFAFSMLEVSDSLMLAQRQDYYPITKAVYELFQLIGAGPYLASALGVWAMVFLAIAIAGSSLLLGRRMGALFRL